MKAEGYAKRRQPLGDWTIEIETYQLGDVFYCTINNVDPGARFARVAFLVYGFSTGAPTRLPHSVHEPS